jgi:hypothetical protein
MTTSLKAVTAAIRENNVTAVSDLLTESPELLDEPRGFWLSTALGEGHYEIAKLLLDLGVNVDAPAIVAATPLTSMVAKGNVEAVKWLVDHGASLERPSDKTDDPLLKAIHRDQMEMMQYLISIGFDPEFEFDCGTTAISYAQYFEKHAALKELGGVMEKPKPWVTMQLPDFTGTMMTTEKLAAIEHALNLCLPNHLRNFLLEEFPSELYFNDAPDNDIWKWLGPDSGMFHTVRSYIAYNSVDSRSDSLQRLYDDYLVIGTNGGGDTWCVDTTGSNEAVHLYEHELDAFAESSDTLIKHAHDLIASGYGREQT